MGCLALGVLVFLGLRGVAVAVAAGELVRSHAVAVIRLAGHSSVLLAGLAALVVTLSVATTGLTAMVVPVAGPTGLAVVAAGGVAAWCCPRCFQR